MLTEHQLKFRRYFLSPLKQKFFYLKYLPMGLISRIRLVQLDEEKAITEVPFCWRNRNPFGSMYFAVQSMAAELSTAVPVFLALKGIKSDVAVIIINVKAEFLKQARTDLVFQCLEYEKIKMVVKGLNEVDTESSVTIKTIGTDDSGDEVAVFFFTWSFRRRL